MTFDKTGPEIDNQKELGYVLVREPKMKFDKPPRDFDNQKELGYVVASDEAALESLVSRMPQSDIELYHKHGHNRIEPVFIDRVMYLYKCAGRDSNNVQRPAIIEGVLRVINMSFDLSTGFQVTMLNETTNEKQVIGHGIARLFGTPIFISVPNQFFFHWNLVTAPTGKEFWDPAATLYIKTANLSRFFSYKNYYVETPKQMRTLYPLQEWSPNKN